MRTGRKLSDRKNNMEGKNKRKGKALVAMHRISLLTPCHPEVKKVKYESQTK